MKLPRSRTKASRADLFVQVNRHVRAQEVFSLVVASSRDAHGKRSEAQKLLDAYSASHFSGGERLQDSNDGSPCEEIGSATLELAS